MVLPQATFTFGWKGQCTQDLTSRSQKWQSPSSDISSAALISFTLFEVSCMSASPKSTSVGNISWREIRIQWPLKGNPRSEESRPVSRMYALHIYPTTSWPFPNWDTLSWRQSWHDKNWGMPTLRLHLKQYNLCFQEWSDDLQYFSHSFQPACKSSKINA